MKENKKVTVKSVVGTIGKTIFATVFNVACVVGGLYIYNEVIGDMVSSDKGKDKGATEQ